MQTIHYQHASFLKSAAKLSQCPADQGVEVAFVGRSNVGKSSALNLLTQQKNLARTSKTPGRTQLINFFSLNEQIRLVDLPGYGYAKVAKEVKSSWNILLTDYLSHRNSLSGIVLLMDIRHPLKDFDMMMLQWCEYYHLPVHILLTKADKLSRGKAIATLKMVERNLFSGSPNIPVHIQLFSVLEKIGLEELKNRLEEWLMIHKDKKSPGQRGG